MTQDHELQLYLRDIASSKLLTPKEEAKLARRIAKGDTLARNRLVSANLRFVVRVAKEYQGRGLPLTGLIGVGNVRLLGAADRFDGARGVKFISYAVWWIRQSIRFCVAEDTRMVRLPHNHPPLNKILKLMTERQQDSESHPLPELEVSLEAVESSLAWSRDVLSLDAPLGDDSSLMGVLPDTMQKASDAAADEDSGDT